MISPGNAPSALTVGALDTLGTVSRADDRVAPYSSRGPSWYDAFAKPDVVAPGHNMLSVAAKNSRLRKLNEKLGGSGNYMRLSGTSMAAGVASGVVGLVIEANPQLTPNALKAILEFTGIPVKDDAMKPYDAFTQGAGGINGVGAIKLASAIDASQPIGSKWLMVGMPFRSTIGGVALQWAGAILGGPTTSWVTASSMRTASPGRTTSSGDRAWTTTTSSGATPPTRKTTSCGAP